MATAQQYGIWVVINRSLEQILSWLKNFYFYHSLFEKDVACLSKKLNFQGLGWCYLIGWCYLNHHCDRHKVDKILYFHHSSLHYHSYNFLHCYHHHNSHHYRIEVIHNLILRVLTSMVEGLVAQGIEFLKFLEDVDLKNLSTLLTTWLQIKDNQSFQRR